ncbi:hypothetical protein HPB49_009773 [Dermacentor silvarum]|uniref:Uncharacterized protein n=1 Tax=Dermacentor silvarum TaxID=543639 RepID=A0ACB8D4I4_DERSI|nr:hypothetical protein HPB49_009773 [Dermacentor silvarum]
MYETWEKQQLDIVEKHTQKIATTHQTPRIDARLAHLWEARRSLTERWKRQRHNKKLRKRIREINYKAAEYAADLCKESWLDLCDGLQGTLSTRKTWQLLRHLIDPMTSKSETNRSMARTLNNYEGDVCGSAIESVSGCVPASSTAGGVSPRSRVPTGAPRARRLSLASGVHA